MKHTISVLVENKFGVLARISGLFSARGYNISSLAVSETEEPTISRMTIVVEAADEKILEQIKKQLELLEKYEQLKKNLDKDAIASQISFKGEIEKMNKEILSKKSEYESLSRHVKEQELKIDEEIAKAQLIPKNESILRSRIRKIREEAKTLEMQLSAGNKAAELGKKLKSLKDMAMRIEEGLSYRQKQIAPLLEKSREQSKKIEGLQKNLIDKVMDSKKESKKTALNQVKSKLQKFFAYKQELNSMLKKINTDFEQIKAELKALYDEAQAIRLTSKSPKAKDYIAELEKKFKQIEKKKSIFESEITKLWSLLAGKA